MYDHLRDPKNYEVIFKKGVIRIKTSNNSSSTIDNGVDNNTSSNNNFTLGINNISNNTTPNMSKNASLANILPLDLNTMHTIQSSKKKQMNVCHMCNNHNSGCNHERRNLFGYS